MSVPLFTPDVAKSFLEGMCADPAATAEFLLRTGTGPAYQQTPEYAEALNKSRQCLENHVKVVQHDFNSNENPEKQILDFSAQFYLSVYYSPWAHWKTVV